MFPDVLYELFSNMPRQGPGSNECTRKAYHLIPNLTAKFIFGKVIWLRMCFTCKRMPVPGRAYILREVVNYEQI